MINNQLYNSHDSGGTDTKLGSSSSSVATEEIPINSPSANHELDRSLEDKTSGNDIEEPMKEALETPEKQSLFRRLTARHYLPPIPYGRDGARVVSDPWVKGVSFSWGVIVLLISGTLYGFTILSNEIKLTLNYSQREINEAISIGDVGIYIGVIIGYIYDLTGPFVTCLIACVMYLIGYLGVMGMVNKSIPVSSPLLMSFFLFLVGHASHGSFTAAIVTNTQNFPLRHRGKITGLLVGFFAISSGVFGVIYRSSFKKTHNIDGYLVFLAILLSSVTFIGAFLLRAVKTSEKSIEGKSILLKESTNSYELLKDINEDIDEGSLEADDLPTIDQPNYLDGRRDISGLQLFKTYEYYLMFIVYFLGAGSGLMFLNNIGPLVASQNKPESLQSDLVIIFAGSNLAGRLVFGLLSDLASKRISRFWFVVCSNLITCITHFVFAFNQSGLIPACIFTGIAYGAMVSLMVSLSSLRFGARRFGLNFGMLSISSAMGSLIFGEVSGKIYDRNSNENHECSSDSCYQLSFIITGILNAFAVLVGILLIYLNRRALINLVYKRGKISG